MHSIPLRKFPRLLAALAFSGVAVGLAGCNDIRPVAPFEEPVTDPMQLYMSLTLNYPAVNLSTTPGFDTVRLTATPRDAQGHPMANLPAPTFTSADTTKLLVTADGKVTALSTISSPGLTVTATLTAGPVTHTATAYVRVQATTNPPPKLASLSIHPIPPDSAIWSVPRVPAGFLSTALSAVGIRNTVPAAFAVDSTGAAMPGLIYAYTSLDSAVATFNRQTGEVAGPFKPGQVRRVVETYAYGIPKADTVAYTVNMPIADGFYVSIDTAARHRDATETFLLSSNTPNLGKIPEVRIAPGGFVSWFDLLAELPSGDTVDVTFDDATNVVAPGELCTTFLTYAFYFESDCSAGSGFLVDNWDPNFATLPPYGRTIMVRQFPVPGVYSFHSTRRPGAQGRVVVAATPD